MISRLTGAANKGPSSVALGSAMPSAIVIGAGVFGASLADRLAREGWEVTLVDRFEPGHPRAESGGETRLIRCSHGPDAFYARSARRALELWRELGEDVLVESGVAWFARREDGWEADSEEVLAPRGSPSSGSRRRRGRGCSGRAGRGGPLVNVADLAFVLHEPEAGVLRAADGVRALVRRAQEAGAVLVRPRRSGPGEPLEADAVVWACGAWLARLFPGARALRTTFQQLVLFEAPPEWDGPAGSTSTPPSTATRVSSRSASRSGRTPTAARSTPTSARSRREPDAIEGRPRVPGPPLPGTRGGSRWRRRPAATTASAPTGSSCSTATPSSRTSGCSAAAPATATSTARRWPSMRRRCWPAVRSPSRASPWAIGRRREPADGGGSRPQPAGESGPAAGA